MHLPDELLHSLKNPLPGKATQEIMAPTGRNRILFEHKYTAAVLISLFQQDGRWRFPLIKRAKDEYVHSGQIALPGGRIEAGETPVESALREAEEEVGLNPEKVRIIGQLTPLLIPVSKFLVFPVVGIVREEPKWTRNSTEVDSIFTVSIDEILDDSIVKSEMWKFAVGVRNVPFFYLNRHKVWGATAMILSEFKSVLKSIAG